MTVAPTRDGARPAAVRDRPDPALEVTELVKHYAGRRVVSGVSFSAVRGQVLALLGPNGAGKTTILECCEGLRTPDSGAIRVLGHEPAGAGPGLRARVGVMLQDGGLPNGVPAADVLFHAALMHADPISPLVLMEALGLIEHGRTKVRRLSGGQRQRLALAAAIVGRPDLVFLDEPSTGLDPHARIAVWALISRLRSDGVAVVLTTHLMEEAERLADRVVVIDGGRVVADGSPEQLTRGAGPVLRFSAPPGLDLRGLGSRLPGMTLAELRPGQYQATGSQASAAEATTLAQVLDWCERQGVVPAAIRFDRRSLEDVFLDLTGRSIR